MGPRGSLALVKSKLCPPRPPGTDILAVTRSPPRPPGLNMVFTVAFKSTGACVGDEVILVSYMATRMDFK